MNSITELQIRNAVYQIIREHCFAPELYPLLNDAGYSLLRTEELHDIVDEIMSNLIQNHIEPETLPPSPPDANVKK